MNAKVAGQTVQDVAASISGSTWWKRITGDGNLSAEIAETIAKDPKLGWDVDGFRKDIIQDLGARLNFEADEAKAMAGRIKPGDIDKSIDKILKSGDIDQGQADLMKKIAKDAVKDGKNKISADDMNLVQAAIDYPRAYFSVADKEVRSTRINTAVGGYAGLAIGGRILSGGSLTRNEYGESDIAGIPFI